MPDIINSNLIELNIKQNTKDEIIKKLAELINNENRLIDYDEYVKDVLYRESITTTGIGFGIAIPHGKSSAVKIPTVAVGKIANGVEWDSLDGKPVNIVFQLAVPEESSSDQHLKILAALSRKLMNDDFVEKLFGSSTKDELLNLLSNVFEKVL